MGVRKAIDLLKEYDVRPGPNGILEIANVGRDDLAVFIGKCSKTGVEVGVEKGQYSFLLMQANPKMKMYGVDPYQKFEGYLDHIMAETFPRLRAKAEENLKPYSRYKFIIKTSEDAVKDFKDNSLDFVYIDGNHSYPFAKFDIEAWTPKVKEGGIVSGHDYARLRHGGSKTWGVQQAVNEYVAENNIQLYTWGMNGKNGLKRDGSRSWMFIKE